MENNKPNIATLEQQMKWLKFEASQIIERAELQKRHLDSNEDCRVRSLESVYKTLEYFYSFYYRGDEEDFNFENEFWKNLAVEELKETLERKIQEVKNLREANSVLILKMEKLDEEIKKCRKKKKQHNEYDENETNASDDLQDIIDTLEKFYIAEFKLRAIALLSRKHPSFTWV